MECPACGASDTAVIDSRNNSSENKGYNIPKGVVRRRRKCMSCDERFSTTEMYKAKADALQKSTKLAVAAINRINIVLREAGEINV